MNLIRKFRNEMRAAILDSILQFKIVRLSDQNEWERLLVFAYPNRIEIIDRKWKLYGESILIVWCCTEARKPDIFKNEIKQYIQNINKKKRKLTAQKLVVLYKGKNTWHLKKMKLEQYTKTHLLIFFKNALNLKKYVFR